MRRMLKEFALVAGSSGLGLILFIIASSQVYINMMFYVSWGYPLPWHYKGDLVFPTAFPFFGYDLGAVTWDAFYEDLLFWIALPVLVSELSVHLVIPYVARVLRLRQRRRTSVASAYGFGEW